MAKDAIQVMDKLLGPPSVGRILKDYRITNDMNQKELAKKLGVTVGFISNVETGKKRLSLSKVLEYCRKLKENEIFWMMIHFKEEGRRAGKDLHFILEEKNKKRA